jgi:hypothetical protein
MATISVHHIPGSFFFGYEGRGEDHVRMALPEKALLDILYLSQSKSRLFAVLPEVEFPPQFRIDRAHGMIRKIADTRRRSLVMSRFQRLLDQQADQGMGRKRK